MEMTSCLAYGAAALSAGAGCWLLAPVRSRLALAGKGRERLGALARLYRREKEKLAERIGKERKEREIYEAISFLRNVISVDLSGGASSDMVLERLAENRGTLKPAYLRTLSLLRMNKAAEAEGYFAAAAGGGLARDFIRVVLQWDRIEPKELAESLVSYQKSLKETRLTARKRKDELISDLIYVPVVINVMVIFLNFIYVAYFVGQKEMFTSLFG